MSVLLRKEIRSLLPAWIMTMAAAALIVLVLPSVVPVLLFVVGIGSVLLGITSFGSEFSQGTFSLLLAQPIPRGKIWRTKTMTLGAALLSVAIVVLVVLFFKLLPNEFGPRVVETTVVHHGPPPGAIRLLVHQQPPLRPVQVEIIAMTLIFTVLFFGAAFAGGLLSALAARQMTTAFWIALLFPLAICGAVEILTIGRSDRTIDSSMAAALALYDVLAFLMARRQFLRAQDLPGASSRVISLPAWIHFGAKVPSTTAPPSHRPLRSLMVKEFQLHQVSLGFAAALLVLHLIVLFVRRMIVVPVGRQKDLYELLGIWWLVWFVVPLMIAGVTVAEERRQATLEGSLCLPARKRTQWWIKCAICFSLAIFFGGVMPWLLEIAAKFIGCPAPMFQNSSDFAGHWKFLRGAVMVAAAITLVAFYASSLARNLLQALGIAVLVASLVGGIAARILAVPSSFQADLLAGVLLRFGLPSLFALLLWLSYLNFKDLAVGWRLWLKNASVLLVFLFVLYGTAAAWLFTQQLF